MDIDIQYWQENNIYVFGLQRYALEINQRIDSDIENKGSRKKLKKCRMFKLYKQVLFYFRNKQQTATLLSNE